MRIRQASNPAIALTVSSPSGVLALLQDDQRRIVALAQRYRLSAEDDHNGRISDRCCALLTVHLLITEHLLYPFARPLLSADAWLDDAEIARYVIREVIAQLHADTLRLRHRDALFAMLATYTQTHFDEADSVLFEPLALLAPDTRALQAAVAAEKLRLEPWFGLAEESPPERCADPWH